MQVVSVESKFGCLKDVCAMCGVNFLICIDQEACCLPGEWMPPVVLCEVVRLQDLG